MSVNVKIRDDEKQLSCTLETLLIYEASFKSSLLSDYDIANDEKQRFDVRIILMRNILFAMAKTNNEKENLSDWNRLEIKDVILSFAEASKEIIQSITVSPKNE